MICSSTFADPRALQSLIRGFAGQGKPQGSSPSGLLKSVQEGCGMFREEFENIKGPNRNRAGGPFGD